MHALGMLQLHAKRKQFLFRVVTRFHFPRITTAVKFHQLFSYNLLHSSVSSPTMCDNADRKTGRDAHGIKTDFSIEFREYVIQVTSCFLLQLQDPIFKWISLF